LENQQQWFVRRWWSAGWNSILASWRRRRDRRSPVTFALISTGINLLTLIPVGVILVVLFVTVDVIWGVDLLSVPRMEEAAANLSRPMLFYLLVLKAPVIETFLFQVAIIELARSWRASIGVQVAVCAAIFMLAHLFSNSVASGLTAGTVSGFFLSLTYAVQREKSFAHAYSLTAVQHSLTNLFAFLQHVSMN